MARWINFMFLIAIIGGIGWLFSHKPAGYPNGTIQPASKPIVTEDNGAYVVGTDSFDANPREEAAKLNIDLQKYDDCDAAKMFYGEGLKVEQCNSDGFKYRQKTKYGFDGKTTTVIYDSDMKELGLLERTVDTGGKVSYSGLSLGGSCRVIESLEEACRK